MEDQLHGQENEEEAQGVFPGAGGLDGRWAVTGLGNVVVEGEDWACEVERSIDCVAYEVAEGEVRGVGGDGDAVSFGEVGGVELLLLGGISRFME